MTHASPAQPPEEPVPITFLPEIPGPQKVRGVLRLPREPDRPRAYPEYRLHEFLVVMRAGTPHTEVMHAAQEQAQYLLGQGEQLVNLNVEQNGTVVTGNNTLMRWPATFQAGPVADM
jgi:hypothetical protein